MPATYEPIATTTISISTPTITFTSIPQSYTDLIVILSQSSSGVDNLGIRFNNDSATNYSLTRLIGNGSTVSSSRLSSSGYPTVVLTTYSGRTMHKFDIFNYTGSTNKIFLTNSSTDKNGSGETISCVGLWRNTAAINQIDLYGSLGNGTTATLYGTLKA